MKYEVQIDVGKMQNIISGSNIKSLIISVYDYLKDDFHIVLTGPDFYELFYYGAIIKHDWSVYLKEIS